MTQLAILTVITVITKYTRYCCHNLKYKVFAVVQSQYLDRVLQLRPWQARYNDGVQGLGVANGWGLLSAQVDVGCDIGRLACAVANVQAAHLDYTWPSTAALFQLPVNAHTFLHQTLCGLQLAAVARHHCSAVHYTQTATYWTQAQQYQGNKELANLLQSALHQSAPHQSKAA